MSFPKRFAVVCLLVVLAAVPAFAQDPPPAPPEPNQGSHVQFTGSYTFDGQEVSVLGATIPITSRIALVQINAFAPKFKLADGSEGVTFHTLDIEYGRNLGDFFKGKSEQVNLNRFFVAGSIGFGSARNAQGQGNSSFAIHYAGRATLCVKQNEDKSCQAGIDLVNVQYWQSRIARLGGPEAGSFQVGAQARLYF